MHAKVWFLHFSLYKTDFTDHCTPGTIHGCRDSVLVCKMYDCNRLQYAKISNISVPCHQAMQAIAVMIRLAIWKQTTSKCFQTYLALHIIIQIVKYIDYSIA